MHDHESYWNRRYERTGCSGGGSRGEEAASKVALLNRTIRAMHITSVIDLGCGDGYVTSMLPDWVQYLGYDASSTAVRLAEQYASPSRRYTQTLPVAPAEMTLSLDVIFHLVEEPVYQAYVERLFALATRAVFVWSSNYDKLTQSEHVRDRLWTGDVPPGWVELLHQVMPFEEKEAWVFVPREPPC